MSASTLIVHKGARLVERKELDIVQTPPPTATWFLLAHAQVLDKTVSTLESAGFRASRTEPAPRSFGKEEEKTGRSTKASEDRLVTGWRIGSRGYLVAARSVSG
jgi:hypothetical protein